MGFEAYKRRLAYGVTVGISAYNLLLKSYITKVLEYKGDLNKTIKFVCVAVCSLVMSLHSRDLPINMIQCRLNHTAPGF